MITPLQALRSQRKNKGIDEGVCVVQNQHLFIIYLTNYSMPETKYDPLAAVFQEHKESPLVQTNRERQNNVMDQITALRARLAEADTLSEESKKELYTKLRDLQNYLGYGTPYPGLPKTMMPGVAPDLTLPFVAEPIDKEIANITSQVDSALGET